MAAATQTRDISAVLRDLDELATVSDPGPGVTRVAYGERDGEGRAWFERRCAALGLRCETDRFGNCFGWAPGCDAEPALLLGSHLDSVREAGRYDGVLGVVVAFELARALLEGDPAAPVAVVSFACEESLRFGIGTVGSRLLLGHLGEQALSEVADLDGMALRDVLAAAGCDPAATSSFDPARVGCFVEVHVDQGSALADGDAVGIVTAIAGSIRTRIRFEGEASHSGAHVRARRRNALLGAARYIAAAQELWSEVDPAGDAATVTVGWIENHPNAPNSVAGATDVIVDLRTPDPELLSRVQGALEQQARAIARAEGLAVQIGSLGRIEPVGMSPVVVGALTQAALDASVDHRLLPSMAGHDAEVLAHHVPTAMLFVANPAAVSHNPGEAISERSLAATLALLDAALPRLRAASSELHATAPGGAR